MNTTQQKRGRTQFLNDAEIRQELSRLLLDRHSETREVLIVEEFGCNAARADMAVFTDVMHCFEIKSGRDKLGRLANQVPEYSAVFDRVTLITEKSHLKAAVGAVPKWWGIMQASPAEDEVKLRQVRAARKNRGLSKAHLARMLWRDDAYALLKKHGRHDGLKQAPARQMWQAVEGLPLQEISLAVRQSIMRRGGSGFRPPLMRNGGS